MGPQGERSSSSFSTITQSRHLVGGGLDGPLRNRPPGAGLRRQSRRSNGGYFDPSLRLPRLVLRGDGPSGREVFQQLLDDHAVAPLAVEPSVPPVDADHPEAGSLVQREARRVLGKDPGDEPPDPASPAGVKEALEGRAPRAV